MLKLTTELFIKRAREVHGDRYIYSEVKYKNNYTKVIIICELHGKFEQIPSKHLLGHGCPKCGETKLTTELFIKRAREVHGDEYDYSKVDYKNTRTKIIITCKIHGDFEQTPNRHLSGSGCPKCGETKLTTELFIKRAREVHGDEYGYSKVDYKNTRTKIIITCKIHGDFEQTPNIHLSGSGCPKCRGNQRLTTEKFIEEAREVHGNEYGYSKVDYKNTHTKIIITCKIHGDFEQTPNSHLSGKGCPFCKRKCSKNEMYLFKLLKNKYPTLIFIKSDRSLLKGKGINGGNLEIDNRIQDKNNKDIIYVEWNGDYFHSNETAKKHDKIKLDTLGDKLITINDYGRFNKKFVEEQFNKILVPILNNYI